MLTIKNEDVISADLLSIEEVKVLPQWILANGHWWWLQSPGYTCYNAAFVYIGGSVDTYGHNVDDTKGGVRPTLKVSNLPNLTIGETVGIFGLLAQYIGNDSVLLCEPIGYHRFDAESNNYERSEIKSYLDDWFEEKRREV